MLGCSNCKYFSEYIGQGDDKVLVCQLKKYATMNNWFKQKDLTPGCFVGNDNVCVLTGSVEVVGNVNDNPGMV